MASRKRRVARGRAIIEGAQWSAPGTPQQDTAPRLHRELIQRALPVDEVIAYRAGAPAKARLTNR